MSAECVDKKEATVQPEEDSAQGSTSVCDIGTNKPKEDNIENLCDTSKEPVETRVELKVISEGSSVNSPSGRNQDRQRSPRGKSEKRNEGKMDTDEEISDVEIISPEDNPLGGLSSDLSIVPGTGKVMDPDRIRESMRGDADEYRPPIGIIVDEPPREIDTNSVTLYGREYQIPDVEEKDIENLLELEHGSWSTLSQEDAVQTARKLREALIFVCSKLASNQALREEFRDELGRVTGVASATTKVLQSEIEGANKTNKTLEEKVNEGEIEMAKLYAKIIELNEEITALKATAVVPTTDVDMVDPEKVAGWKRKAEDYEAQLHDAKRQLLHWQEETAKMGKRNVRLSEEYAGKYSTIVQEVEKSITGTANELRAIKEVLSTPGKETTSLLSGSYPDSIPGQGGGASEASRG